MDISTYQLLEESHRLSVDLLTIGQCSYLTARNSEEKVNSLIMLEGSTTINKLIKIIKEYNKDE